MSNTTAMTQDRQNEEGPRNNSAVDRDAAIRLEVERIRRDHPYNGDYRAQLQALASVLFFKFGEKPAANRLSQLLAFDGGSPSTTTAQSEVNKFWEALRQASKVRLNRPDLPDFLLDLMGDAAAAMWQNALDQANGTFEAFRQELLTALSDAQGKLAVAEQARLLAEQQRDQALTVAAESDASRQAIAIELASVQGAHQATERERANWQARAEAEAVARAQESEDLRKIIEGLQDSLTRVENEQRRLLTVSDDYKQSAARDRAARLETEQNNKALMVQMQTMQGTINRLSSEHGQMQGRMNAADALADRLQKERDQFFATAQLVPELEARIQALQDALLAKEQPE